MLDVEQINNGADIRIGGNTVDEEFCCKNL